MIQLKLKCVPFPIYMTERVLFMSYVPVTNKNINIPSWYVNVPNPSKKPKNPFLQVYLLRPSKWQVLARRLFKQDLASNNWQSENWKFFKLIIEFYFKLRYFKVFKKLKHKTIATVDTQYIIWIFKYLDSIKIEFYNLQNIQWFFRFWSKALYFVTARA